MTSTKGMLALSLLAVACGGSTQEAESPAPASEPVPAAAEPAPAAAAPSDAPAGGGWEGEGEAKTSSGSGDAKPAAAPDKGAEETRTLEVIQKIIKDHRPAVRECYDKARKELPSLQGDMTIHLVLDPEGKVKVAELNQERSTLKAPPVVDCAIKVLKGLAFPPSSRGMESTVNYPFNFTPSGPPAR